MTTSGYQEAQRVLRKSVKDNKPQVMLAEETIRLLRDGDELNKKSAGKQGAGMDSQRIINVLAGLVLAFLGWWSNNIWQTMQTMQTQVTNLNVELARNYVPRVELQANFDRINAKLDLIDRQTKGGR